MYSEAIEIMRYAQKQRVRYVTLTMAMRLAQFSFPIEEKFRIIEVVVKDTESMNGFVWALGYFLEPFRKAESDYHKGSPPEKGEMMKVSEILGIKE